MKPNPLIFLLLLIALFLLQSCQKDNGQEPADQPHTGSEEPIISYSDCKIFPLGPQRSSSGNDQSCVEYNYNAQTGDLQLTHINSGFNCCPEVLYVMAYISNDTILIEESEKEQGCLCSCLYDIDISIPAVPAGQYYLKIVEPYCGSQPKLEFEIDLNTTVQDIYCVARTEYPWGISTDI